jgi:hypothetical protein
MIMNIPAEAGIQNPHCISPFATVSPPLLRSSCEKIRSWFESLATNR